VLVECVDVCLQLLAALQVDRKADADYILGTCHKAKGTEEDYVQLADDFVSIADGRNYGKPVD
jgi:hypothetical protein